MWVGIWLAIGLFATAWTFAWALGRDRIYVKAGTSLAAWALFGLSGGSVYHVTDAGVETALNTGAVQLFAAGMAVLSFAVMLMYRFDEYPPRREGAA